MSLAGLVYHTPAKGGFCSRYDARLDDLESAQPKIPGKGSGDEAIGFDHHDWAQGDNAYTASVYSEEELSSEDNAGSPSRGPGDAETAMSDDPHTEPFPPGIKHVISKIVGTKNTVFVPLGPHGISGFTATNANEHLTEAETSSQEPTPTQPPTVTGASGAKNHISLSSGVQSLPESRPEVEEEPEDTPRHEPQPRITSEEQSIADPGLWLVRKARQRKLPFQPPYDYRSFLTIAKRQLYPIDSAMPRETHPMAFHVAVMYRDDRVGRDRHNRRVARRRYKCLSLEIHTEIENPGRVFTPSQLQTLDRLTTHPIREFRDLNVVRIFDLLYLQDGRNTTRQTTMRLSHRLDPHDASSDEQYGQILYSDPWLINQFAIKVREILGADATAALIRMHRFPEEPLLWKHDMEPLTFVTEFMWRIDHPIINVYPVDWRPVMSFEEAEEERAANEAAAEAAAVERVATERAAAEKAAADILQAGQVLDPVHEVNQGTVIELSTTQNSGIRVPAIQEPGIQAQVTQVTGEQPESSRPQGPAAHPSTTNDPSVLGRLDLIENTLRELMALNRRQAPRIPNFKCPQLAPTCALEVPVEPRHNFETRVQQHLMGHVWGGGNLCALDRYCHARLELMNNGQRTEHQLMHNLHRRRGTATGPPAPRPTLLPPVVIRSREPSPPPASPSPPNASDESDVAGAPRKGANYCGVCGKFINNLAAAKKREHLNQCKTKKRYMKTKTEVDAEEKGGPSKVPRKEGGRKRKVDDGGDDDRGDDENENEGGSAARGEGQGGDAGGGRQGEEARTEGGEGGSGAAVDLGGGRRSRQTNGARTGTATSTRRPIKRARGGAWAAKTKTSRPEDKKGKGKAVEGDDGDDGNHGNSGDDGNNGEDGNPGNDDDEAF